ncbi:hypothetical protein A0H81_13086 [Grifola frondosa]|uniref:ShKT domain-containing protein n=1 Tax=Grifola frondosa TaxID=5627 RepID=A0A1C7LQK6_GRIFR|nr:hypothetical protein A0H81_13086 [Grifola frondosa]
MLRRALALILVLTLLRKGLPACAPKAIEFNRRGELDVLSSRCANGCATCVQADGQDLPFNCTIWWRRKRLAPLYRRTGTQRTDADADAETRPTDPDIGATSATCKQAFSSM